MTQSNCPTYAFRNALARAYALARYVLERLIGPHTRALELLEVRRRLAEQTGLSVASPAERQLALRLRLIREELDARFEQIAACARCVRPPSTDWPGGHCCSGDTLALFTDSELSALGFAGTTPAQLKPPLDAHVGCAFRGMRGCSLPAAHRPCLCVRYACDDLERELKRRADYPTIVRLRDELRISFERFAELRKARLEETMLAKLRTVLRNRARRD